MQHYFKNRRFLSIFLLISIAAFLVLPKICLANDFENITLKEIEEYLSIPANAVENLIHSLINLFNSQWINRISDAYSTPEESAVPNIMRGVVRVQALNHLLIDAPIEITWGIIKNATKIARLFLTQDPSSILDELEKESVKRATEYGMNFLLQKEIRITPGAINFKYDLQKGGTKETIFQYIMIYKPIDAKRGKLVIRFYSPNYLEIPKNEGSITGTVGRYTELTHPLPPFIVDIQGTVEDYKWVGQPSMKVEFPPEVPDLGIKPLTFWERHVLKPIESTIKDIEVIITKITGISPKIVENLFNIPKIVINIWNEIKSTFSKINPFSPAALVETPAVEKEKPPDEVGQGVGQETPAGTKVETLETKPQTEPKPEPRPLALSEVEGLSDLEKMQEELDDIAERIDIMSQEVAKLVKEKGIKEEQEEKQEIKELEEKEEKEEKEEEEEEGICNVNINTASKKELQKLTGVGPVIAQRIIEARPFSSIYDLIKVSGIGEITLQKIINQGCAYVEGDTGPSSLSPISASDGGGGASPSLAVTYPKILISEIKISPIEERFIELYNPNNQTVNLTGWYMQRKTATGATWESLVTKTNFENKAIQPYNYFLIARSPTLNPDILIENLTLTEDNSIVLKNPKGEIVDEISWGEIQEGFSYGRIWDELVNNYSDGWEIQNPTPKAQNQSPEPEQGEEEEEEEPEQPEQPQLPQTTVINEIAWMGTKASASDEWIEFYNNTEQEIDLTNWKLKSSDLEGPEIILSGAIPSKDFYLIERTNDEVTSETANWKGPFGNGLSNTNCEILYLYDAQDNLIDQTVCLENVEWPAGKASPDYISMERINSQGSGSNSENWRDNNLIIVNSRDKNLNQILGTPKEKNSVTYQPPITLPQNINWNLTLTTLYSPYIINGTVSLFQGKTLTIEPGVVIKFMPREGNNDSQLYIFGTLKAVGTPEEKIIFTSYLDDLNDLDQANLKDIEKDTNQDGTATSPYPGAWKWILFGSPEPNINPTLDSELVNVLIRYGDADNAGVIKVEKGSSITIKDSRLEKNKRGIWLVSSPNTIIDGVEFVDNNFLSVEIQNAGSPTIKNSNFEGKEGDQIGISVGAGTSPRIENNFFTKNKTPIIMYAGSVPILTGNRGENNQLNGIVLSPSGGPYPEGLNQITWKLNKDFPYIIEDVWRVVSGITLKIEPGTVIKFGSLSPIYWNFRKDAYFEIQGELFAEGADEGNPIVFTSLRDDDYGGDTNNDGLPRPEEQGPDWKGIVIKSQASATLKWLKLRYAGAEGSDPLTIEEGANVSPDPDERAIVIEP